MHSETENSAEKLDLNNKLLFDNEIYEIHNYKEKLLLLKLSSIYAKIDRLLSINLLY